MELKDFETRRWRPTRLMTFAGERFTDVEVTSDRDVLGEVRASIATGVSIASPFGPRPLASGNDRYDFHRGIDIATDVGTPAIRMRWSKYGIIVRSLHLARKLAATIAITCT